MIVIFWDLTVLILHDLTTEQTNFKNQPFCKISRVKQTNVVLATITYNLPSSI